MGSGSASQKAGMNGGMDYLCGRLVYYDEITNDFGSADSERITAACRALAASASLHRDFTIIGEFARSHQSTLYAVT